MRIKLVTVGKLRSQEIEALVNTYCKRIPHYMPFELSVIPDVKTGKAADLARQKDMEGKLILQQLAAGDVMILFDEHGRELTSRDFASYIEKRCQDVARNLIFVIGGPYGFSNEVYQAAGGLISLSKMTLTHEMARLFAVEQIYRAMTIINGEPYHHD